MIKQKGFAYLPIILIIIILGVIGAGGYLYIKNQSQSAPVPTPDNSFKTLPATDGVEGAPVSPEEETELNKITTQGSAGTENWKTYRSEKYGLEIKYPPVLYVADWGKSVNMQIVPNEKKGNLFNIKIGELTFYEYESVEVFLKNPSSSLESAIDREFLNPGNYRKDCLIKTLDNEANKNFPFRVSIEPLVFNGLEDYLKCPYGYSGNSGFFMYNPQFPDKYLFVKFQHQAVPLWGVQWWPNQALRFYK